MFEFEYIPLILMVVIALHTFIVRRVNSARDPYRMALAGRFHELKEAGAPDWLLDFWLVILGRASFSHGQLKWGILAMLIAPSKFKLKVKSIQKEINKLPSELRDIHDKMDRDFAMILLLSSPYFAINLIVLTLIIKGSIELAKVVPAKEARGELAVGLRTI